MEPFNEGDIIKNSRTIRRTTLREHQLEVKNSLINPFENISKELDYI